MARRNNVGTRSSSRLTKRKKQSIHNNEKTDTSHLNREDSSSASVSENKSKPLSSLVESEVPLPSTNSTSAASLRTTTSRRGGKSGPGATLTVRAASALKRSQTQQISSKLGEGKEANTSQETMSESSQVIANSQPSSAAAAAAAAAQALCDNPVKGRFAAGQFRGYQEDRQNVFRARRDESVLNITTRSKSAINKPKIPIGSSTVRIMGSATPTHISRHCEAYPDYHKKELDASKYTSPARSNKMSVFRNPPTDAQPVNGLESSPQQILLSLKSGGSRSFDMMRSPTASTPDRNHFEHKDDDRFLPQSLLSPEAPPQIQHSHLAGAKSETFFFDPRMPKTPKTPNVDYGRTEALQGTPSFSLFNQSFDSFGDSGYLRSPIGGEGALIDQALPGTFSLEESSSPHKRSLMASPRLHGFTFSPHERKSDNLDHFASESPGVLLDKCIVEAMEDAPFMPTAHKISSDPLLSSNAMMLEPNKTLRNVPPSAVPTSSTSDKKPSGVPVNRRMIPLPLERRLAGPFHHPMQGYPHGPPPPDHRMMHGPPPVPRRASVQPMNKPPLAPNNVSMESHARPVPVPSRHVFRRPQPPPHMHRSGRHTDMYRPAKRSTTLSGLNVDDIHERLVCHKDSFNRCTFLLPGFRRAMQESVGKSTHVSVKVDSPISSTVSPDRGGIDLNEGAPKTEVDIVRERDIRIIAGRRISSAICAFGGQPQKKNAAAAPAKSHYTESVINRFFEHESRISWDVEESPPVESADIRYHSTVEHSSMKRMGEDFDMNPNSPKKLKLGENPHMPNDRSSPPDDAPKMRYRCKLCGKPKQNHKCPYERSLQRSIGITVHSAINSFSAAEPGILAPPLIDMNNFLRGDAMPEITPARPKRMALPDVLGRQPQPIVQRSAPHVTPEQMISSKSPPRYKHTYASPAHMILSPTKNVRRISILSPEKNEARVPPSHRSDNIFVESVSLRTEQFRSVLTRFMSHFEYPTIPLPYMQRKSLSDNLFELSKELPLLKEECAIMLRQAREEDMWDVAVAELLTQVIVAIHCPAEDKRLEGLSRYLNSMGFAC